MNKICHNCIFHDKHFVNPFQARTPETTRLRAGHIKTILTGLFGQPRMDLIQSPALGKFAQCWGNSGFQAVYYQNIRVENAMALRNIQANTTVNCNIDYTYPLTRTGKMRIVL